MNATLLTLEGPPPTSHTSISERLAVWYSNWKNRHVAKAFRVLEKALRDDPEYARGWKANISMAIYDESRPVCMCLSEPFSGHDPECPLVRAHDAKCYDPVPIGQCNNTADRIMRQFFDVDTSGL